MTTGGRGGSVKRLSEVPILDESPVTSLHPPAAGSNAAPGRPRARRLRARARAVWARVAAPPRSAGLFDEGILDLFEELVYAGEITPDGHYIDHSSSPMLERFLGGSVPDGMLAGALWESRVHPEDVAAYEQFNRRLLRGEDAEVDLSPDRARRRHADPLGPRTPAAPRRRQRARPRDHLGRHGAPGGRRSPRRGERAVHRPARRRRRARLPRAGPSRRAPAGALPGTGRRPPAGRRRARRRDGELGRRGAPRRPAGVRRVQRGARRRPRGRRGVPADRRRRHHPLGPRPRRRPPRGDGTIEISGIVSDVTERRRMRAELAEAHAALSRVVEAMDDHLYTLEVDPGRRPPRRLPRPEPRRAGRRLAARRRGGRAGLGVARAPRRPRAPARGPRAPPGGRADRARVPRRRPRRPRAHRARPHAPAPRGGRHALLRRRHARHHRAAPAGGRAAAQHGRPGARARRGRAARAHGRADRRCSTAAISPRSWAGRLPATRTAAGCCCSTPITSSRSTTPTATSSATRCSSSSRAGCRPPRPRRLPRALGRRGVRRAAARRGAPTRSSTAARSACATAVASSPVAAAGVGVRLTISVGAVRAGAVLDNLDALVEAADRCLYVAKRQGATASRWSRTWPSPTLRRASPRRCASRARSRSPPASARGCPRPMPSRWPCSRRSRRSGWRCRSA